MDERAIRGRAEGSEGKELRREGKAKKINKVQIREDIHSKDINFTALAKAQPTTLIPKLQNARKEQIPNRPTAIKLQRHKIPIRQNPSKERNEEKGRQLSKVTFLICKQIQI